MPETYITLYTSLCMLMIKNAIGMLVHCLQMFILNNYEFHVTCKQNRKFETNIAL